MQSTEALGVWWRKYFVDFFLETGSGFAFFFGFALKPRKNCDQRYAKCCHTHHESGYKQFPEKHPHAA